MTLIFGTNDELNSINNRLTLPKTNDTLFDTSQVARVPSVGRQSSNEDLEAWEQSEDKGYKTKTPTPTPVKCESIHQAAEIRQH